MKPVKLTIWSNGDPSVGIPGGHADVTLYISPECMKDNQFLPAAKEILVHAFGEIWDERKVFVMTEEEDRIEHEGGL